MPIVTTAYRCEHCQKFYRLTKASTVRHEQVCLRNPQRRSCLTCIHFIERTDGDDVSQVCALDLPNERIRVCCMCWWMRNDQ